MVMKPGTTRIFALGTLVLGAILFVGCDVLGGLDDRASGEGTGAFTLLLTDAPFPYELVSEANVWIDSVDVVSNEDEVTTLATFDPAAKYNLLELQNGVTTTLFDGELESGTYSQVRLYVSSASIVLVDEQVFDLKVPSERVKVLLTGMTIEEGLDAELTLDFDVSKSFIVQGNPSTPAGINGFIFTPVVKPIDFTYDDSNGDVQSQDDEGDGDEENGEEDDDETETEEEEDEN